MILSPADMDIAHHKIGIIGGGFSGTLVLANLIQEANQSFSIEWFEANPALATGVAYGTQNAAHLLNVRAENMGAFPDKVDDFYQWLKTNQFKQYTCDSFVPRLIYAKYLRHVLDNALLKAQEKKITVEIHQATVIDAVLNIKKLLLTLDNNKTVTVNVLVLATGNLPPRRFSFPNYIHDVWKGYPQGAPLQKEILIIGTGLTMVDTVLSLKSQGYQGKITAISRNGLLPTPHAPTKSSQWEPEKTQTALGLLKSLRAEITKTNNWRSAVDALRPVTQKIWKELSIQEKKRFLKRLSTLWNVHRHRMAPEIHEELAALQKTGQLRIIKGNIKNVDASVLVLNCTGPEYNIEKSEHLLLKSLLQNDLIRVGELPGIQLAENGTAKGKAPNMIFPIGPLCIGELLECTAVPELRQQAQQVAKEVLKRL